MSSIGPELVGIVQELGQIELGQVVERPARGLLDQPLQLDRAVLIAATLQDDEARRWPRRPGLDDEMAEIGKADRAFVLGAFPGRDERAVGSVLFDRPPGL